MGNVILNDMETKFNNGVRMIYISLEGRGNPHLNLLKHCKLFIVIIQKLGSLIDVRKMYDKFKLVCQGKHYKYLTKRTLHEVLPFSITTNCRIYDNFNVKNACNYLNN